MQNSELKGKIEGHVLSSGTNAARIREKLGLPPTGTDFSDASGLAAVLSNAVTLFDRNSGKGDGAGWGFGSGPVTFSNWVDGVFFSTSLYESAISPFVIGVPSGSNPVGTEGTAVWTGDVVGRDLNQLGHLAGDATLTYDFNAANLDVLFDQLRFYPGGSPPTEGVADMTWDDLSVSNGLFGDCSGSGTCIRGRFFNDNEGNAAESVGGVFRNGSLNGAFGAERQ